MRRIAKALLLACVIGCSSNAPPPKPMLPITRVPSALRRSAMAAQPGVRFHTAFRLPNGGYELRGNDLQGKVHEIVLSADGSVLKAS